MTNNNFAFVEHMADRNVDGVSYIKEVLATVMGSSTKEEGIGFSTMSVIKDMARRAFGSIPLFRTQITENSIETFQVWYNEFAETNNLGLTLRVTGVWNEPTQNAFDLIVRKFKAA